MVHVADTHFDFLAVLESNI